MIDSGSGNDRCLRPIEAGRDKRLPSYLKLVIVIWSVDEGNGFYATHEAGLTCIIECLARLLWKTENSLR